ncbi:MAG: helix-turn-helix domain-containing protein [Minicystis sp.]
MAAAIRKKLLTASDLATLCEVDLKTIHNWVDRGRISHFRTPGRHLRFRAADVADFLRTWGYAVPRDLRTESAREVMVIGPAESLALVNKVLGATSPIPAPSPSGVGLTPPGGRAPSEPPGPVIPADPRQSPLRHLAHPYDALIAAGAEPADVYVVDLPTLAAAQVTADHFLEALHRSSPQATFIALSDLHLELPRFAHCIGRSDSHSLEAILSPQGAAASEPPPAVLPHDLAANSSH